MQKITGMEAAQEVPPKVLAIYRAVEQLIAEGENLSQVSVSTITELAGIGKGTAYDYFENKDEIIVCSLLYQIRCLAEELQKLFRVKQTFPEQISCCLDELVKQSQKQQCFMSFVHVLTENSGYCQQVKERMQQEEFAAWLPMNVLRENIIKARERGEIKKTLPLDYVVYEVFAKLLAYLMSIHTQMCLDTEREDIRPYVYKTLIEGLCESPVMSGEAV